MSSGLHKPYSVGRPACVVAHVSNVFDHSVSCRPSWSEVTDPHFLLVSQGTVFRFCSRQWGTVTMMASTEDPKFNLKPEQPWGIFNFHFAASVEREITRKKPRQSRLISKSISTVRNSSYQGQQMLF
jgi:hypothetical protein